MLADPSPSTRVKTYSIELLTERSFLRSGEQQLPHLFMGMLPQLCLPKYFNLNLIGWGVSEPFNSQVSPKVHCWVQGLFQSSAFHVILLLKHKPSPQSEILSSFEDPAPLFSSALMDFPFLFAEIHSNTMPAHTTSKAYLTIRRSVVWSMYPWFVQSIFGEKNLTPPLPEEKHICYTTSESDYKHKWNISAFHIYDDDKTFQKSVLALSV